MKGFINGKVDINIFLAFTFGVVFISIMLVLAILFPNPQPTTQWVFVTVLAISAAGVGAVIPGILNIELPFARAGGALAILIVVYFLKPAIVEVSLIEPTARPGPVAENFLELLDRGSSKLAWNELDDFGRSQALSQENFEQMVKDRWVVFEHLVERKQTYSQLSESPSGAPQGLYRLIGFNLKFDDLKCREEVVGLRADGGQDWTVVGYRYSHPFDC